jgi:hypothetical protein
MYRITALGMVALLTAVVIGARARSNNNPSPSDAVAANAAKTIDPLDMMKDAKDLPVHTTADAI